MGSRWFIVSLALSATVLIFAQCKDNPPPPAEQADCRAQVHALCKKLAHENPTPIGETELEQFRSGLESLSYDEVLAASRLMEPDPREVRLTPNILPGAPRDTTPEPWETPARLVAARLLALAPVHTSRYIQTSQLDSNILDAVGYRCGSQFTVMLGGARPALAWQETLRHYQKYWNIFDQEARDSIPGMAISVFRGLWQRDPVRAQQYLLEKTYRDKPWAKLLQQHALHGVLIAIEHDPEQLEKLIAWLEDEGVALPHELRSHSFRIDLSVFRGVDLIAVALLAKIDPERAIAFAKEHDNPRLDDWQYAIYAGWVEFWPYSQRALERYYTRSEDAMTWLARSSPGSRGQTHVHNAFCHWRSDDNEAVTKWLGKPAQHQLEKKRKAYLVNEFFGGH